MTIEINIDWDLAQFWQQIQNYWWIAYIPFSYVVQLIVLRWHYLRAYNEKPALLSTGKSKPWDDVDMFWAQLSLVTSPLFLPVFAILWGTIQIVFLCNSITQWAITTNNHKE